MDWKHLGACYPLSPVIEGYSAPKRTKKSISLCNIYLFEQANILVSNLKLWRATKSNVEFGIENLSIEFSQIHTIDRCCFYYFVRNSLVALLEALCARIFSFRFVNIGFFLTLFFCVCARSLTKPFFRLSQPDSCAWLSPFLLCADCTCVLVCVCLYMCMWKCVGKVMNI